MKLRYIEHNLCINLKLQPLKGSRPFVVSVVLLCVGLKGSFEVLFDRVERLKA